MMTLPTITIELDDESWPVMTNGPLFVDMHGRVAALGEFPPGTYSLVEGEGWVQPTIPCPKHAELDELMLGEGREEYGPGGKHQGDWPLCDYPGCGGTGRVAGPIIHRTDGLPALTGLIAQTILQRRLDWAIENDPHWAKDVLATDLAAAVTAALTRGKNDGD